MGFDNTFSIGLYFGRTWKEVGPTRVRREGKLIEGYGRVAAASRIFVFMPDAADLLVSIENQEIINSGFFQLHCGSNATQSCPDHCHT